LLIIGEGDALMKWLLALGAAGLSLMAGQSTPDQSARRSACMDACMRERLDPDLQRQEVLALERETVRAIQLKDPAFFNRVYSDDFSGVSSRGEMLTKVTFLAGVQAPDASYATFSVSRINVRLYRDTAVATSLWSIRSVLKGQPVSGQMQVTHVYVYTPSGYRAVSSQITLLPPYVAFPL
jgi:hypothetical protein